MSSPRNNQVMVEKTLQKDCRRNVGFTYEFCLEFSFYFFYFFILELKR